jgi:NitT/TauT family transport system permease protein
MKDNINKQIEDKIYWKPKSKIWIAFAAGSFAAAFAFNYFIPQVETANDIPYRIFLTSFVSVFLLLFLFSFKYKTLQNKIFYKSQFIFASGLSFTIWDYFTTKTAALPLPFFPGPSQVFDVFVKDFQLLCLSALYSTRLFFAGIVVGIIFGIGTGILIGWSRQCDYWISPVVKISGVVPAVAWIPLAIVIFPNGFSAAVFLIFIASWFSVSYMTAQGIRSTPNSYFEAARTLGAKESFLLFHIAIPNAVPNIFTGILTAVSLCFATLVVSEMLGAKAGLGWYINWAKSWAIYSKVYCAIAIMAIEFSIILAVINRIKSYILRWQKGILK